MTLEPTAANAFIASYKELLLEIARSSRIASREDVLSVLDAGRRRLIEKPSLLDEVCAERQARSEPMDVEFVRAIRSLRVTDWVFLRDTRTYSIFVHPSEGTALGVLGLTQRIRDIVGTSGVVIETGVIRFAERFVCDGLISRIVHLGPNYRKSYARLYSTAKAEGRFYLR